MSAQSVAVREAATVMLVRDAPGLEVFMLRRHPQSTFVPGAYVFPGGQVDAEDGAPAIVARSAGLDPGAADDRLGVRGASRFWVAAVREAFEEAGVLVARTARDGSPLGAHADHDALATDRVDLLRGRTDLPRVLAAHDAVLDLAALVPFGRWITPLGAPKRFDTWFFVAAAPVGHAYAHDDDEMVASEWLRPDDALDRARTGEIELIYPTIRSLLVMRRYATAAAFLAAIHDRWHRPRALRVMDPGQGWQLDLTTDDERRADDAASGFVMRMGMEPPPAPGASGGPVPVPAASLAAEGI